MCSDLFLQCGCTHRRARIRMRMEVWMRVHALLMEVCVCVCACPSRAARDLKQAIILVHIPVKVLLWAWVDSRARCTSWQAALSVPPANRHTPVPLPHAGHRHQGRDPEGPRGRARARAGGRGCCATAAQPPQHRALLGHRCATEGCCRGTHAARTALDAHVSWASNQLLGLWSWRSGRKAVTWHHCAA